MSEYSRSGSDELRQLCGWFDELSLEIAEASPAGDDTGISPLQRAYNRAAAFLDECSARCDRNESSIGFREAVEQMRQALVARAHFYLTDGLILPPSLARDARLRPTKLAIDDIRAAAAHGEEAVPPPRPRIAEGHRRRRSIQPWSMLTAACGGFITPYPDCAEDYDKEYKNIRDLFGSQGERQ